jgi:DNA mismatch repair ATPase MutS
LQVLENTAGGRNGTLLAALDHCKTSAGKRCLQAWICRPLLRIDAITARQDAVQSLMIPELEDAVGAAQKAFQSVFCSLLAL